MKDEELQAYAVEGTLMSEVEVVHGVCNWARWTHPQEVVRGFDVAAAEALRKIIKPGDLVVDIGAHSGDTALPMALAAGTEGLCIAFEPSHNAFCILCANAELNTARCNILPVKKAVMPVVGTYTFHYTDPAMCNGGYFEGLEGGKQFRGQSVPVEVEAVRLDEFLSSEFPGRRMAYLKIDTEGRDTDILRSHADLIAEHHPVILTECYPGLNHDERLAWLAAIRDLGYTPTVDGQELTERTVLDSKGVIDALCLRKTRPKAAGFSRAELSPK